MQSPVTNWSQGPSPRLVSSNEIQLTRFKPVTRFRERSLNVIPVRRLNFNRYRLIVIGSTILLRLLLFLFFLSFLCTRITIADWHEPGNHIDRRQYVGRRERLSNLSQRRNPHAWPCRYNRHRHLADACASLTTWISFPHDTSIRRADRSRRAKANSNSNVCFNGNTLSRSNENICHRSVTTMQTNLRKSSLTVIVTRRVMNEIWKMLFRRKYFLRSSAGALRRTDNTQWFFQSTMVYEPILRTRNFLAAQCIDNPLSMLDAIESTMKIGQSTLWYGTIRYDTIVFSSRNTIDNRLSEWQHDLVNRPC